MFDNMDEKARFLAFKKETQEGLAYPCICCHRIFFKNQVIAMLLGGLQEKLERMKKALFNKCISPVQQAMIIHGKVHLCHTCQSHLKRGNMPPLSTLNGLVLEDIPDTLQLSDLENTLIAKNILFMKIFKMPTSRWSAVKDRVVNVPITDNDISQTLAKLTTFPRSLEEGVLVPVQWKRKLEYKQNVDAAFVNTRKLISALKLLRRIHPAYKDIQINEHIPSQVPLPNVESDGDSNEDEEDFNDPHSIQRFQSRGSKVTGMVEDFPEMRLVINSKASTVQWKATQGSAASCPIAPGEGFSTRFQEHRGTGSKGNMK